MLYSLFPKKITLASSERTATIVLYYMIFLSFTDFALASDHHSILWSQKDLAIYFFFGSDT